MLELIENVKVAIKKILKKDREFKNYPSVGQVFQEQLESHVLFPELSDSHIRLVNWFISHLEFKARTSFDRLSIQSPLAFLNEKQLIIPGGVGQLPHAIAYGIHKDDYGLEIACDVKIDNVMLQQTGIEVSGPRGTFSGDAVVFFVNEVLALPIQILAEKISFKPRLPSRKLIAMQQLEMGTLNKISLVFPRIFWPLHVHQFGSLAEVDGAKSHKTRGRLFLFQNMYNETQLPCLTVFVSGTYACKIESSSDTDIIAAIMDVLTLIFPSEHPLPYPIESVITRWQKDIYSGGSTSILKHQGDPDSIRELMSDSKRLYLAGEYASHTVPGTLQGNFNVDQPQLIVGEKLLEKWPINY